MRAAGVSPARCHTAVGLPVTLRPSPPTLPPTGVALVRPDGPIAWHVPRPNADGTQLLDVLRQILAQP